MFPNPKVFNNADSFKTIGYCFLLFVMSLDAKVLEHNIHLFQYGVCTCVSPFSCAFWLEQTIENKAPIVRRTIALGLRCF